MQAKISHDEGNISSIKNFRNSSIPLQIKLSDFTLSVKPQPFHSSAAVFQMQMHLSAVLFFLFFLFFIMRDHLIACIVK